MSVEHLTMPKRRPGSWDEYLIICRVPSLPFVALHHHRIFPVAMYYLP